jgi:type I restriction enzyme, S subunit
MASMTTRASLNNEMMAALKIVLPPLPEQKAIASILSSLDDKIDLLHRQNKTLEAIAETLFRQWFIEKAQDDWEESVLAKVVTITRGASPRPIMDYVQKGTVPWIKIADATGSSSFYIDSTKEFIIESGVSKSVEVYPGDLILSNSATCGLPYFVEIYGCIHDGWLLFRNFDLVSKYFVFFFLKQINRELNQVADGSVQNNLNTAILKEYPFRIPDKQALNQFDACVEPIIEKMKGNNRKIQTLEKLRDTLLPKLMSGEVRVEI